MEKIMSNYKIDTKCIQSGYEPKNGEPRVLPIYQSTTYRYTDADNLGDLFDLKVDGHMYSRISNPTLAAVEAKIADLEGGTGAMLVSSGQAANLCAILNITSSLISLVTNLTSMPSFFKLTAKRLTVPP